MDLNRLKRVYLDIAASLFHAKPPLAVDDTFFALFLRLFFPFDRALRLGDSERHDSRRAGSAHCEHDGCRNQHSHGRSLGTEEGIKAYRSRKTPHGQEKATLLRV